MANLASKQAQERKKGAGGRPKRTTISEKETLDKSRSLGRRTMLEVTQAWVDELKAERVVFHDGFEVARVPDYATRLEAQKQLADRCGFRFDPNEAPSDVGRELLAIFARIDASAKPGGE